MLVGWVLPDGLDTLLEQIEVRVIFVLARPLAVLIDGPEFLYGVDGGNRHQTLVEVLLARLVLVPEFQLRMQFQLFFVHHFIRIYLFNIILTKIFPFLCFILFIFSLTGLSLSYLLQSTALSAAVKGLLSALAMPASPISHSPNRENKNIVSITNIKAKAAVFLSFGVHG